LKTPTDIERIALDINLSIDALPRDFNTLFADVIPEIFEITYVPQTEYDDDVALLHAFKIDKSSKIGKHILRRAREEVKINHLTKFRLTVVSIRLAMGADFQKNYFIRMLAHYINYLNKANFAEPFFEGSRGVIDFEWPGRCDDILCPVRCTMLINYAMAVHCGAVLDSAALRELVLFLFKDPYHNVIKFKNAAEIPKLVGFCTSGSGVRLMWSGITGGSSATYNPSEVNRMHNDAVVYEVMKDEVDAGLKALRELGLPYCADKYKRMISAPVTETNVNEFRYWQYAETGVGYLRGNSALSFRDQLADPPPLLETSAIENDLKRRWMQLWDIAFKKNYVPSFEQYLRRLPSKLTTKSAGQPGTKVTFKTRKYGVIEYQLKNKTELFMDDPYRYIQAPIEDYLISENPGGSGIRYTSGRATRSIYPVPFALYTKEGIYADPLYKAMEEVDEIALTKRSGKATIDHLPMLEASASGDYLLIMTDFSKYDASERKVNVRDHMTEAGRIVINQRTDGTLWGPKDTYLGISYLEIFERMMKKMGHAFYSTDWYSINGLKKLVFEVDSQTSGEYPTIMINSVTCAAFGDALLDLINEKFPGYKVYIRRHTGDDAIYLMTCPKQPTVDEIKEIRRMAVDLADRSSLRLKPSKFSARKHYADYLKVAAIYGWLIERTATPQLFSAENNQSDLPTIEALKGYVSFLLTVIVRGYSAAPLLRYFKALWLIRRKLVTRGTKTPQKAQYIPYTVLYAPSAAGGIGKLPWSLYGANVDILITTVLYKIMPEQLDAACSWLKAKPADIRAALANDAIAGGVFEKGLQYIKDTASKERFQAAAGAMRYLESASFSVPRQNYLSMPKDIIRRALKDSEKFRRLDFEFKNELNRLEYTTIPGLTQTYVPGAKYIQMRAGTGLKYVHTYPYMPLAADVRDTCLKIGFSQAHTSLILKFEEVLKTLHRDTDFPRHYSDQYLFEVLTSVGTLNPQAAMMTVIALGASESTAQAVIVELNKILRTHGLADAMGYFSFGDPVCSILDGSTTNAERIVTLNAVLTDNIKNLMLEAGVLYSITMGGVRVEVTVDSAIEYDQAWAKAADQDILVYKKMF
jgi:hypothetical protein